MLFPFLLLGVLVLVVFRYRRTLHRHSNGILPRPASYDLGSSGFRLSWETKSLNSFHDALVSAFARRGPAYHIIRVFYDVGAGLGVVGVPASVAVLLYQCVLLYYGPTEAPAPGLSVVKRDFGNGNAEAGREGEGGGMVLKPLIPGVTVPWSEVPLLLAALLLSQAFHELGHIISSALSPAAASLSSVGLALQGAFVALLPHPDEAQFPWTRVRNAAAGAWHNVVLWLLLWAACRLGVQTTMRDVFWRDVLPEGLAIISVDRASPLRGHLELGALIVSLDDTQLRTVNSWDEYLLAAPSYLPPASGWCVDSATFLSRPTSCELHPGTALFTPFPPPSFPDSSQNHCADPLPVFRQPSSARCASSTDCTSNPNQMCVAPAPDAGLLRLQVKEADHGHVIVWKGPRREVREQVRVGQHVPRLPLVPVGALAALEAFFAYLRALTLALALLNLLPLRALDGGVVLSGVLELCFGSPRAGGWQDVDLGDIELGQRQSVRRARMPGRLDPSLVARWVHNSVAILGLLVLVCSMWTWIIRGP